MRHGFVVLTALVLANCAEAPPQKIPIPKAHNSDPWFIEEATERGILFTWESGAEGNHHMPEIIGGGVALIDIDQDEDLDLYFVQGGSMFSIGKQQNANQLFLNEQGLFRNITTESKGGDMGYGMGVSSGDYDNDGDLDLYITNFGKDTLLRNNGNATFTDVSKQAGMKDETWTTASAFLDYDRDGDLDLFVSRYLEWDKTKETECGVLFFNEHDYCSPVVYQTPLPDLLYENNGDGTFTDVSIPSTVASENGYGLGIGIDDFNGDGYDDIFVANDMSPHHLWINQCDGSFANEAMKRGCAIDSSGSKKAGMGTEIFDADFDGDPDILVVNMENQSDSLFLNDGNGYFSDATGQTGLVGLSKLNTRFGVLHEDFNNDGYCDLYIANGRISRKFDPVVEDVYAEQNLLFSGNENGVMTQILPRGGTANSPYHTSRAAASGDLNGDGKLDIVVVNRDAQAYLLNNVTVQGSSIELDIRNSYGAPAIGAIVRFTLNGIRQRHRVRAARSYFTSMSHVLHIGLGKHTEVTDVDITWPSTVSKKFDSLGSGRWNIEEPVK
ncbi:MAG: CRTAC1 family protein [Phycisphaerales bacterium]|nr:CRTAC1 family protein [Phycisphaerales bacterium]